jgi:hypothetical protein
MNTLNHYFYSNLLVISSTLSTKLVLPRKIQYVTCFFADKISNVILGVWRFNFFSGIPFQEPTLKFHHSALSFVTRKYFGEEK